MKMVLRMKKIYEKSVINLTQSRLGRGRNSRKNEGSYKAWTQIRKVREGNYFIAAGGTAYR